jgi:endonuclease/exonuclease/phosphatase (EEP) superfamily protein YafD
MNTLRKCLYDGLKIGGLLTLAVSLCSFAGTLSPAIDIFSHFRVQYASMLTVLALIFLAMHKGNLAATFAIGSAINCAVIAALWLPPAHLQATSKTVELSILDMNLCYENDQYERVRSEIRKYNPDVVVLEELVDPMMSKINSALEKYPYRVYTLRPDAWGIGVFSKYRLRNIEPNLANLPASFAMSADILIGTRSLTLVGVHTIPQLSLWAVNMDEKLIKRLTDFNSKHTSDAIMIGDFNATPWSEFFRQLTATGRFVDSEQGFGWQPSWVGFLPLSIPIDHCLYTPDCRVLSRRIGDVIGSDHLPVFLRLAVPQ